MGLWLWIRCAVMGVAQRFRPTKNFGCCRMVDRGIGHRRFCPLSDKSNPSAILKTILHHFSTPSSHSSRTPPPPKSAEPLPSISDPHGGVVEMRVRVRARSLAGLLGGSCEFVMDAWAEMVHGSVSFGR